MGIVVFIFAGWVLFMCGYACGLHWAEYRRLQQFERTHKNIKLPPQLFTDGLSDSQEDR